MNSRIVPILLLAAACAAPTDRTVAETTMPEVCGGCEPEHFNAKGVINIEGGNACIDTGELGLICPLSFQNVPGGGVTVYLAREDNLEEFTRPLTATYNGTPITLVSINATATQVVVAYAAHAGQRPLSLSGAALANVVFSFELWPARIDLQLDGPGESPRLVQGVYEHNVRARVNGGRWSYLCTDDVGATEPASLLGGAFIDPVTAARTASASTVMLSCKKGGITTCMQWGYKPWLAPELVDGHLSCIQMKRAAYCGKDSHTKSGTAIHLFDAFGIQRDFAGALEALWTPTGASCVNLDHRRRMDIEFNGLCDGAPKPPCNPDPATYWNQGALVGNGI